MITIDKWQGLVTNASPYAIPPGAAVTQVNLQVIRPGQTQVRPGTASVSFATHAATTSPILTAFRFQHSTVEQLVYQNALGEIRVAKGPS